MIVFKNISTLSFLYNKFTIDSLKHRDALRKRQKILYIQSIDLIRRTLRSDNILDGTLMNNPKVCS
jgi:hypothetical protein